MENNTIYVSGLYLNRVSEKAPNHIITNQDIHVDTMIKWLQENRNLANEKGYIKITGKESKEKLDNFGNPKRYFQVDTWKPKTEAVESKPVPEGKGIDMSEFTGEVNFSDIPF